MNDSSPHDKSYQHPGEVEQPAEVQEAIRKLLVDFGEIPDRTSPEDFPQGYVLTREEIVGGILRVLAARPASAVRAYPAECDWPPAKPFTMYDDPDEHKPCYLVLPDGAMIAFGYHGRNGVNQAQVKWIMDTLNAVERPITRSPESIERIYNEAYQVAKDEKPGQDHDLYHLTGLVHVYAAGMREHASAIRPKCQWQAGFDCGDSICIEDRKCQHPEHGPLGRSDRTGQP